VIFLFALFFVWQTKKSAYFFDKIINFIDKLIKNIDKINYNKIYQLFGVNYSGS